MSAQELSRIAGGIALVAMLVIAGLVAWSTLRAPEPEFVPQLAGGPATGDMVGYVGRVDPETRVVDIAEDPAGIRAVSFAVTNDTLITVHGKPSGLTDLAKDTPVRVSYEVRNDVKYVTAIQVVAEEPRPTQANVTPSGAAEVKGSVETKAETVPVETKAAETKAADAKPAEARPVETRPLEAKPAEAKQAEAKRAAAKPVETQPPAAKKTVTVVPEGKTQPAPPVPSTAATAPPRAPAPSSSVHALAPPTAKSPPAPASPTRSAAGTPAPTAAARRPADSDVTDGTAAIDWLLKGPQRR